MVNWPMQISHIIERENASIRGSQHNRANLLAHTPIDHNVMPSRHIAQKLFKYEVDFRVRSGMRITAARWYGWSWRRSWMLPHAAKRWRLSRAIA